MATAVLEHQSMSTPQIDIDRSHESFASRTVNLKLWFGLLGNSRKVTTDQITVNADEDMVRVSKHLLESPELDAIKQLDSTLRRELDDWALPGFDIGVRVVSLNVVERVVIRLKQHAQDRAELVETFLDAYPRLCREAADKLRTLYDLKDYPPTEVVRSKFHFAYKFMSFGAPEALQEISSTIFAEERDKAARTVELAAEESRAFLRQTVAELVSHLRDRLTPDADGKPKRLHETAVTNLQQFLSTFSFRNVANDRELEAEVTKLRDLLGDTDVQELKKHKDWRENVREDLGKIETSLSGLIEHRPTRKYRFAIE